MEGGPSPFIEIKTPSEWDVNLKDLRIDIKNQDQKLSLKVVVDEYNLFWTLENHTICNLILTFAQDMIKAGKIYNKKPDAEGATALTMESDIIKKWMGSERVRWTLADQKLWTEFYKEVAEYQKANSKYEKCVDLPDRRIIYTKEEGSNVFTVGADNLIDCPLKNLVATHDQAQILDEMFPTFYDTKWARRVGDLSGLLYAKQKLPWPLADRDMCFTITMIVDHVNKGLLAVSRSLGAGAKYYDVTVPEPPEGLERIEFTMCFNYFQWLGDNKCRHFTLNNVDAKIEVIPEAIMGHIQNNIMDNNVICCRDMAVSMSDP